MSGVLVCIDPSCHARFDGQEVIYVCPRCGSLLEAELEIPPASAEDLKELWRERRLSNSPIDQSGVWRFRELLPKFEDPSHIVTLREGNTPLLPAPKAAQYAALD